MSACRARKLGLSQTLHHPFMYLSMYLFICTHIFYACMYTFIYDWLHSFPPPCLLGTSGVFLGHVVCPIPHSGIFLNCFKGPQAGWPIRSRKARMNISDSFFECFSIFHFFTFLSQNTPRKGVQKSLKIVKINKKTLTGSSLEIIPAKNNSKV